ncbi:hypothetical protein [Oceanobacillus kapialis]|uniref:hypothetical protein n=1 Tax=Oceanobacillus kapialis TaxID=481353 RepID=UPI00384E44DB
MKWKTILIFTIIYVMLLYAVPFLGEYISTITAYLVVGVFLLVMLYGIEKLSVLNRKIPFILGVIMLAVLVSVSLFI